MRPRICCACGGTCGDANYPGGRGYTCRCVGGGYTGLFAPNSRGAKVSGVILMVAFYLFAFWAICH